MKIEFIKVHGSQNDFFIIDERLNDIENWSDERRTNLALLICARDNALRGADGILFVSTGRAGTIGKMRVFNADGSEASMCGNGLRTVARYLLEKANLNEAKVETMKADLLVQQNESLGYDIPTYQVEISPVLFDLGSLPFNYEKKELLNEKIPEFDDELTFSAVAVPNPHLITFTSQAVLESSKQEELSHYLNGENPYFPDGVNVSFVRKLTPEKIFVRTYERGVGFTNACGTAMSASSLIKKLIDHDKLDEVLDVYNDGGRVRVKADEKSIQLIGNATFTAFGTFELGDNGFEVTAFSETGEQENYLKMVREVEQFLNDTK
ncbi:diaminopimelate epimerase [Listeria goaensis]|uniref:diaminopimelate epimerase n=1 Tax=Listeria goaensis TaxID=1649188 RepID=UPI000B58AE76|nr:diaminopimelate epimerase [Listeria goaensis]